MLSFPRWNLLNPGCGKGPLSIFFAGAGFTHELIYNVGVRRRLMSWIANTEDDFTQAIDHDKKLGDVFLILDSGAFSAWSKGVEIDVAKYGKAVVKMFQHFDMAANLDVIPGKKGMSAKDITPAITEDAASRGWNNLMVLRAMSKANGFDPNRIMPIYHQGESMDWLKKMVDLGCNYIGVSPSNDYQTSQRQLWLDDVFDYLLTLPILPRTHGYAVTSPVLMKQYPWCSVDSASWVQQGGFGVVTTPHGMVTLSDRESIMGRADSMDGRDWTPEMREKICRYFMSIGLDMNKLKTSYHERWKANAIYVLGVEKEMAYVPRRKPASLFDEPAEFAVAPKKAADEPKDFQDAFGTTVDGKPPTGDLPMSLFDARS